MMKRYRRMISLILILMIVFQITGVGILSAFADTKEYKSGERVYVGNLAIGDIIEAGAVLYSSIESRVGITTAEMTIDGETVKLTRLDVNEYTTDRMLRVYGIQPSVYSKNICAYTLKTYDEDEYNAQTVNKKGTHLYIGDMKVGDIVGAGAILHTSSDSSGYTSFEAFLDGSPNRVNDNLYEWSPSTPARLVTTDVDSRSPKKLILNFETFYSTGEVGSEAALNVAMLTDDTIILANNIELSDCFIIDDGKAHTLDLNGYTLSRSLPDSQETGHVIRVNSGSKLTLKDSSGDGSGTIMGGNAPAGGGAYVEGEVIVEGGIFAQNTAVSGGGLYIRGSVTINKKAVIDENTAKNGGGIYIAEGGSVTMSSNIIADNKCSDNGGGIYNLGTLNATEVSVTANTADKAGAGIWSSGSATLAKAKITQNKNAVNGGGVFNNGTMTIDNCVISGNSASGFGGGVMLASNANTSFSGSNQLSENYSKNGGGVYTQQAALELDDVKLESNTASESGGGIYFDSDGKLTLKNISVTDNAGGIYMNKGVIELAGGKTIVNNNRADSITRNIHFNSFRKIIVSGELNADSKIGITPPANADQLDVTEGYSKHNTEKTDFLFFSDTEAYKVKSDKDIPEVRFVTRLLPTASGYKVKVTVKVVDDADWWDDAYLYIYVRDHQGIDEQRLYATSPNFCDHIDSSDGYYEYSVDCGTSFPSAVVFRTQYGTGGSWRDFEADVKIYINDINCGSQRCVHDVYGVEIKQTAIYIAGDKYPYPDIEIDQKSDIVPDDEDSKYVTINAVDQYGVAWKPYGDNGYQMENLSFPENDTFEASDGTGMKWKLDTSYETDHYSEYLLTFRSGSNVYPTITKTITVHFSFPLHLTVVVDGETVFTKTGHANDRIQIQNYPCKPGYYINNYTASGACFLESNGDGTYLFAFGKEDIILTASLKGNRYTIQFEKNGDPLKNGTDVTCVMVAKTLTYGKAPTALPKCYYAREGYTFTGWNTKADGSGTMFADKEKVQNLTTVANDVVYLYAQWQPNGSTTTASIFSDGTLAIYIGGAIILIVLIGAAILIVKRKKQNKEQEGVS